jgi:hypothetical protein
MFKRFFAAILALCLIATLIVSFASGTSAPASAHSAVSHSAEVAVKATCPKHSKQISVNPCRPVQLADAPFDAFFVLSGKNLPIGMDIVVTSDDLINGCVLVPALNSEVGSLDGAEVTVDHTHRFGLLVEAEGCNEDTYHISFCELTAPKHCFFALVDIEAPHE